MNNIVDVEVPASIKMVKLELKDRTPQLTLRSILPTIRGSVELVIEDSFDVESYDRTTVKAGDVESYDRTTVKAGDGEGLMKMLERSRVLDGNKILELRPSAIKMGHLVVPAHSGQYGELENTGVIEIFVTYTKPDEED